MAEEKMRELESRIERFKKQREREAVRIVLRDLKNRSARLEETGDFDGAIKLWSDYRSSGAYASALDDVIAERIAYLKREKEKRTKMKEGVE
jgi:hypothetical protein